MTSRGGPTHGKASTYRSQQYACRCPLCTAANTALQKKEDIKRKERLAADPTVVEHGKVSTYINWGCRCKECTTVHCARLKVGQASRMARLTADPSIREHGLAATYNGWGCRCDECTAAASRESKERRGKEL